MGTIRILIFLLAAQMVISCVRSDRGQTHPVEGLPKDVSSLYTGVTTAMFYSKSVMDSFRIFSSVPTTYSDDTTSRYPLLLLLDANAYFESVLSELKLGTLTQGYPGSVVIGIGYKDFSAMDSLRNRDYTFPQADPRDSFATSGGGARFKQFIDGELIPDLQKKFKVNPEKVVLLGHSLGGYFVLYDMLESRRNGSSAITNFIAASPSLSYHDRYLLDLEKTLHAKQNLPVRLYVSAGTLEFDPAQKQNEFRDFRAQVELNQVPGMKYKFDEYSNFAHMDAAMPGFMKGLSFVFEE